jgi:tetratricopeptide (TPR) repeat protein
VRQGDKRSLAPGATRSSRAGLIATAALIANVSAALAQHAPAQDAKAPAQQENGLANARRCFDEGRIAYADGRMQDALTGFLCAHRNAPSPELAWNLGRVYERMDDPAAAIRYYTLYLEANTATANERKDLEQRIVRLEAQRQRKTPPVNDELPMRVEQATSAKAAFLRAIQLFRQRRYEDARDAFVTALQQSDAPEVHYNLAVTSERLGRLHEALDHYHAYLRALPTASDKDRVALRIDQLRAALP